MSLCMPYSAQGSSAAGLCKGNLAFQSKFLHSGGVPLTFWLKKLRGGVLQQVLLPDSSPLALQLSSIVEMLESAFYGLDLLKLHSVTTKLVGRVEKLEEVSPALLQCPALGGTDLQPGSCCLWCIQSHVAWEEMSINCLAETKPDQTWMSEPDLITGSAQCIPTPPALPDPLQPSQSLRV